MTVIPVLALENFYDDFFITTEVESFTDVFIGTALIEEFFKWIVIFAICFKSKHFDETYDAIVYSAYSSLAFACVENVGYVFLLGGISTGILRAFTAVPGHLCDGVIMGYFIGKARLAKANGKSAFPSLFMSLFLPTLAHCIYDYLLGFGEVGPFLMWIGYFLIILIICIVIVNYAAKNNVAVAGAPVLSVAQPNTQPITQQATQLSTQPTTQQTNQSIEATPQPPQQPPTITPQA